MFFTENPFYILSLHTTDGKESISIALREKLGQAGTKEERNRLLDAEYDLTHSGRRSRAEFFWLPLLKRDEAWTLVSAVAGGRMVNSISYPSLSAVILAMNSLYYGAYEDPLPLLLQVCEGYGKIDPIATASIFNEDRRIAGFPGTYDYSYVEMLERSLLEDMAEAARKVKEREGREKWAGLMTVLAEKERNTIPGAELLLACEDSLKPDKEKAEKEIDYALTLMRTHFSQGLSLAEEKVKDWLALMKPVLLWQGPGAAENLFHRLRNEEIEFLACGKGEEAEKAGGLLALFPRDEEMEEILQKDRILISHGLVPEKEEIHFPRFDKVPGSGVIPEAPEFPKKKKLFGIFPI